MIQNGVAMPISECLRRSAVGLCAAVALSITPTAPACADDANPLFELVDAAAERLQTAEPVAASKWLTGGSIEDPQRVEQVLAAVSAAATSRGAEGGYVTRIFSDQIDATEAIEYTRFAQWKLDPEAAPSAAPDLAVSRTTIDRLNTEMVEQVALQSSVLRSPDCAGTLDEAKAAVTNTRMLDSFYQQALSFSTRSYCS
jgi:chorismate mutase